MTRRLLGTGRAAARSAVCLDRAGVGSASAEKFTGGIVDFCLGLSLFPERGTHRDDLRPGLRVLGWRRRVSIALTVEPDAVVILGVFYGGQYWEGAFEA